MPPISSLPALGKNSSVSGTPSGYIVSQSFVSISDQKVNSLDVVEMCRTFNNKQWTILEYDELNMKVIDQVESEDTLMGDVIRRNGEHV